MIRTQLYLPEQIHKKLLQIRELTGISLAKFIRDAIETKLGTSDHSESSDILKLADLDITGGEKDLSSNVDLYFYNESQK